MALSESYGAFISSSYNVPGSGTHSGAGDYDAAPLLSGSGTSIAEDLNASRCCPDLTWQQRLIGCATCVAVGLLLSFGALGRVFALIKGNPTPFVITYSLGSVINILGSCFLTGPKKQVAQMFDKRRFMTSIIFVSCIALAFFIASMPPFPGESFLLICVCIAQMVAATYYMLTYIPFGTDLANTFLCSCCWRKKEPTMMSSIKDRALRSAFDVSV